MLPWALRNTLLVSFIAAPLMVYVLYKALRAIERLGWFDFVRLRNKASHSIWPFVIALFLIANVYPLCLQIHVFFGGLGDFDIVEAIRTGEPWVYRTLVYPYWAMILIIGQTVPLLLISDLIKVPLWRAHNRHRRPWMRIESGLVIGLLVIGTIYVSGRIYHDTQMVTVTNRDLVIEDLPDDFDGFKIVHISDLQADQLTDQDLMQQYVGTVNSTQPDLVCFTGDLVTRGTGYITRGAQMLGKIEAAHGVYACLGDHDIWADEGWIAASLFRNDVLLLDDKHQTIHVGDSRLLLTGATNTYSRRFSGHVLKNMEQQQARASISIFMAHQHAERLVQAVAEQGYDLFLGGHTHGGQVVVKLFGQSITPVMAETPYLAGFYTINNMLMSVNNGLGLTMAPIRFQAPAEVTVIQLRKLKK
jgi:hypothetical protein